MPAFDEGTPEILDRVVHLPGISATVPMLDLTSSGVELAQATKAHLEMTGVDATIHLSESGLFPAVRVRASDQNAARVAIIVPTRDRVDLLKQCIESVERSATRNRQRDHYN